VVDRAPKLPHCRCARHALAVECSRRPGAAGSRTAVREEPAVECRECGHCRTHVVDHCEATSYCDAFDEGTKPSRHSPISTGSGRAVNSIEVFAAIWCSRLRQYRNRLRREAATGAAPEPDLDDHSVTAPTSTAGSRAPQGSPGLSRSQHQRAAATMASPIVCLPARGREP
jgi:hypothetical protein